MLRQRQYQREQAAHLGNPATIKPVTDPATINIKGVQLDRNRLSSIERTEHESKNGNGTVTREQLEQAKLVEFIQCDPAAPTTILCNNSNGQVVGVVNFG